jgi:hypothetical protein
MPKFFTLTVKLMDNTTVTFKNLTEEQEAETRAKIFIMGIRRRTNHNTYQLIRPWVIEDAYIIEQPDFIPD